MMTETRLGAHLDADQKNERIGTYIHINYQLSRQIPNLEVATLATLSLRIALQLLACKRKRRLFYFCKVLGTKKCGY